MIQNRKKIKTYINFFNVKDKKNQIKVKLLKNLNKNKLLFVIYFENGKNKKYI